ncbi:MAG: helicase-related protein, partial [Thermoplasmata archaeon]
GSPEEVASFLAGNGRAVRILNSSALKEYRITVLSPEIKKEDEDFARKYNINSGFATAMRKCGEEIETHKATLLFSNTREAAEALGATLKEWNSSLPLGVHHGSLSKEVRIENENMFKEGKLKGIICTSSLELGIDIGDADLTLQFNSPRDPVRLLQRVGRSSHRVGEVSEGYVIARDPDEVMEALVTARCSEAKQLEPHRIRQNCMSVLANQIIAILMERREVAPSEIYTVARQAYPYRDLSLDDFNSVLDMLVQLRIVRKAEASFSQSSGAVIREGSSISRTSTTQKPGEEKAVKTRRSLEYFYDNISMIPDEKNYSIVDITTRKVVGTLDESFVASFISNGRSWRVVELQEDSVIVSPAKDMGAIPSWTGEEIPVPFYIAMEVGALRRTLDFTPYRCNDEAKQIVSEYIEEYRNRRLQADTDASLQAGLKRQPEVPSDRLITIEDGKEKIIINACFGSRVNNTLAQLLSSILAQRLGSGVGVNSDAYRVILDVPYRVRATDIREILLTLPLSGLKRILQTVLKNSTTLRWETIYVARKFGALSKNADYRAMSMDKFIDIYLDTPLIEEVIEKVIYEKLDVERTEDVLARIRRGDIGIEITGITNIGLAGVSKTNDFALSGKPEAEILLEMKRRLIEEPLTAVCLHCKRVSHISPSSYIYHTSNEDKKSTSGKPESRIVCPVCGGMMIAILNPFERENAHLLKKQKLNSDEKKAVERMYLSADLVRQYGPKALLVLAGRGIGPSTAARILSMYYQDETQLLKAVLSAEIQYAKTRNFWKL